MALLTAWEAAAKIFEPQAPCPWDSPLDLACTLDPRYKRTPALELINEALVWADSTRDARLIVAMAPQEGKGLALDTPIATPAGWTTMGALRNDDEVFGGDGQPCLVKTAYPVRQLDCYRVVLQDGTEFVADGDHRWKVWDRSGYSTERWADGKRRRCWRVVDTRELARDPRRYGVPTSPAVHLPERDDLVIPPYVLGVWLGDGTSAGPGLTCADQEIIDQLAAEGEPVRRQESGGPYSFTWAGGYGGRGDETRFIARLRRAGVLGDKHIPDVYLRAGNDQRLALLQGLMDTDGSAYYNGGPWSACEFTATNKRLANDVLTLARSLGIRAQLSEKAATLNGRYISQSWRVKFTTDIPVFRLTRKLDRLRNVPGPRKARPVIGVRSVEPIESVPTRCIEVTSPDHTFLAGKTLIPTHNSETVSFASVLWALIRDPRKRIALASYGDPLARRWGRRVRNAIRDHGAGSDLDLGLRLAPDLQAANEWALAQGGGMVTAGVHTGLTGRPVDHLVIDDPLKDRDEADSPAIRENVWEFWTGTAVPRLAPGAPVVLVMTRWHHDDLAGRLMREQPGKWRIVHIPAQADPELVDPDPLGRRPGEFMISARGRTAADWELRKAEMGADWQPLAQGAPAAPGGQMFDITKLRYWSWNRDRTALVCDGREWRIGLDCWIYITIDLAFSTRRTADWTVASVWAIPTDGSLVLLDTQRAHVPEHQQIDVARPLVDKWRPEAVYIEASSRSTQLAREAVMAGWQIRDLVADKDKVTRAAGAARRLHHRLVWFPHDADGLLADKALIDAAVEEMKQFPNGRHDDFVDTFAYADRVRFQDYVPHGITEPVTALPSSHQEVASLYSATDVPRGFDPMSAQW